MPLSYIVCTHLRHVSTYPAAVSSVSFPSGTDFSSHISSWMTATASLTCTEPQPHTDQVSFSINHNNKKHADSLVKCFIISNHKCFSVSTHTVTIWVCMAHLSMCADDIREHPSRFAAQSHLSRL